MEISRRTALGFIAGNAKATEKVYGEYKNLMFFVIVHRLSTIKHCDRTLVMEGGKFIEDGTYEELVEKVDYLPNWWSGNVWIKTSVPA